ncbi:hypothetical protein J1N35_002083 [Gossypium stocksii]|uniref:Uncharacterized protein n=1 Tax=Gossypium stocksii TaxID=47602 RepID=A0A9D3WJX2_9ROSI|nr:hypothetical protein J1N35_002083 [Gossypium stocksii]
MPILVQSSMLSSMLVSIPESMQMYLGFATSYNYLSIVLQTLIVSLFYLGGSLGQLPSRGLEETQWKVRQHHSSMKEGNGDEDENEAEGGDEDIDKDDDRDEYGLTPLVVRRNPACTL